MAFSILRKRMQPVLVPAPLPKRKPTPDDIRALVEGTLGCQMHPSRGSNEPCGDPAGGQAHCHIRHAPGCSGVRKLSIWMCRYHLDMAMLGNTECRECGAEAAVVRVLEHSI